MKKATFCFLAVLILAVLFCGCKEAPEAETQEAQRLIDSIEAVRAVNSQKIEEVIICENNVHLGQEEKELCENCVQIEDREMLDEIHSIIKNISYSAEPNSLGGIYDGGTFSPLYFIIDGEWIFIGVWHNDLVFYDVESIFEDDTERLRTAKEPSTKLANILFEYR